MASLEVASTTAKSPKDTLPLFIDENGIREIVGFKLSRTSIYLAVKAGRLPAPRRMSSAKSARRYWKTSEVLAAYEKWPKDTPSRAT